MGNFTLKLNRLVSRPSIDFNKHTAAMIYFMQQCGYDVAKTGRLVLSYNELASLRTVIRERLKDRDVAPEKTVMSKYLLKQLDKLFDRYGNNPLALLELVLEESDND